MDLNTIAWAAAVFSVIGIFINSYKIIYCWPVWIVSNLIWLYCAVKTKNYPQIVVWITFIIFNIWGWYKWSNEKTLKKL